MFTENSQRSSGHRTSISPHLNFPKTEKKDSEIEIQQAIPEPADQIRSEDKHVNQMQNFQQRNANSASP